MGWRETASFHREQSKGCTDKLAFGIQWKSRRGHGGEASVYIVQLRDLKLCFLKAWEDVVWDRVVQIP